MDTKVEKIQAHILGKIYEKEKGNKGEVFDESIALRDLFIFIDEEILKVHKYSVMETILFTEHVVKGEDLFMPNNTRR